MAFNDRDEFRQYLLDSGVVKALSNVLMKIYELKSGRPKSAVIFIHDHLLDEIPSLTEFENLQAESKATAAILEDLKNNGKLTPDQLAMINNVASSKPVQSNIGVLISARQSQIVNGREKTSAKNQSKICQKKKNEPNYVDDMRKEVDALLKDTNCNSLLKQFLTMNLFKKLILLNSTSGSNLIDCISSGLEIHESMVGIYAADKDAYDTFQELFDPIIEEYHKGFDCDRNKKAHPKQHWGDPADIKAEFPDLDPTKKYITSTRIRCIRTVDGFPLIPKMNEQDFKDSYDKIEVAVDKLKLGKWYGLKNMDAKIKSDMISKRYILEFGDRYLEGAGATNHWPIGRAIYKNDANTFFIWVNEEDHLRFISMDSGFDIPSIYQRLIDAVDKCANDLNFLIHPHLGFLTLCPTNLGNTIRASVMIKLPKLVTQNKLQGLADTYKLEVRGGHGNLAKNTEMVEISNKRKLGLTEFESIKELYEGIKEIIKQEESLSVIVGP